MRPTILFKKKVRKIDIEFRKYKKNSVFSLKAKLESFGRPDFVCHKYTSGIRGQNFKTTI